MSDFIRQTAEQLAKDGFVAIAPDLLSRRGGTPASGDSARKLIAQLDTDTLTKDLDATVAYVKRPKAVRPDRVGPHRLEAFDVGPRSEAHTPEAQSNRESVS